MIDKPFSNSASQVRGPHCSDRSISSTSPPPCSPARELASMTTMCLGADTLPSKTISLAILASVTHRLRGGRGMPRWSRLSQVSA